MLLKILNTKATSRISNNNNRKSEHNSKNNTTRKVIITKTLETQRPTTAAEAEAVTVMKTKTTNRFMGITKMLNFQFAAAAMLMVLACSLGNVNGLKCYMCGQYNEGVGSITPCLNYSAQFAHLYLKECSKKSEKFCVKYVSELSTVRDCATECVEKEIWETQTYCCNEEGCNGSSYMEISQILFIFIVSFTFIKIISNVTRR